MTDAENSHKKIEETRRKRGNRESAHTLHSHDVNEGSKHRVDLNC